MVILNFRWRNTEMITSKLPKTANNITVEIAIIFKVRIRIVLQLRAAFKVGLSTVKSFLFEDNEELLFDEDD